MAARTLKDALQERDEIIGKRLRLARMRKRISQDWLATMVANKLSEETGQQVTLTFQQIQKYEKGVNRISVSALQMFAEVLETPITFFLDDTARWQKHGITTPSILDLSPQVLRAVAALEKLPPKAVSALAQAFESLAVNLERGAV